MNQVTLPPPHNTAVADSVLADFASLTDNTVLQELCAHCSTHASDQAVLTAIAGASPFLSRLIVQHPDIALAMFTTGVEQTYTDWAATTTICAPVDASEDAVFSNFRHARARIALLAGLADLSGQWSIEKVSEHLAKAADLILNQALNWALLQAARQDKITLATSDNAGEACGYVVLAMGKHGAYELNYSSDIDLIILYDPELAPLADNVEPATFFVRLTRRLVSLLQDVTGDGYVYRVDLRLRPDPRATQVAIAMEAAATYYENMGQNWERAAMIKARPVAGDIALGEEFIARLRPYIWRKYLDFAAISDIQSLKRQIHAVKGHGAIAVAGHNIKLGRGGIREIEFFAQTQQLIAGGRNPALRGRQTLAMLNQLSQDGWIDEDVARDMNAAYCFLRRLENRLQMLNDAQTHSLPDTEESLAVLASFSGFANVEDFSGEVMRVLGVVQGHYVALFENADELGSDLGSLVFTGGEDDPETLNTLRQMGFSQVSEISATVRGWHFGRFSATRSARSRELLTELMPSLLQQLATSGDPDTTFLAFDRFLAKLPAGVQLFAMLRANPQLLDLIALLLGTAPRLSSVLSKRPKVLDAVIDQNFFGKLPQRDEYDHLLDSAITTDTPYEEALDLSRIIGAEQMFRIGVRILSETTGAGEAGAAFSNLADALVEKLLAAVKRDIKQRHGVVAGGEVCVIAMGKHGGHEMTANSDLDLILIYDFDDEATQSDGEKALMPGQYFARLTQRLISALSVPTAEGALYEVDMRLRPSGNKGPVATKYNAFVSYHQGSAWTWEKLALTRARVVAGDAGLSQRVRKTMHDVLCEPRDRTTILPDIHQMRQKLREAHKNAGHWDIKHAPGGLVDVEFIAQTLQLLHASSDKKLLHTTTLQVLRHATASGLLSEGEGDTLILACRYYHRATQLLRLCLSGPYDPQTALPGLNRLLARALNAPDIASAEAGVMESQGRIDALFAKLFGPGEKGVSEE